MIFAALPEIKLGHPEPTWFRWLARITDRFLPYSEFAIITLVAVLVLTLFAIWLTRGLRKNGVTRKQAMAEMIGQGMVGFVEGIMGPHSERYVPLIGTFFIFILTLNLFGLIPGFISPTASLNTTIALALVTFCVVQWEGVRVHGVKHYIMHFAGEPIWLAPLMFPLHHLVHVAPLPEQLLV